MVAVSIPILIIDDLADSSCGVSLIALLIAWFASHSCQSPNPNPRADRSQRERAQTRGKHIRVRKIRLRTDTTNSKL